MMPNADIAAIRARCDVATPGEWFYKHIEILSDIGMEHIIVCENEKEQVCIVKNKNDALFISHARQDIPALLDEIDRLRAEVDAKRARTDELANLISQTMAKHLKDMADDRDRWKAQTEQLENGLINANMKLEIFPKTYVAH
jgi:uncharacterized coiled-coil DUF342 family protein